MSSLQEAAEVRKELHIQYGEDWKGLLRCKDEDLDDQRSGNMDDIGLNKEDKGSDDVGYEGINEGSDESFVGQFEVNFSNVQNGNPNEDPVPNRITFQAKETSNELKMQLTLEDLAIRKEAPLLTIHSSLSKNDIAFERVCLDTGPVTFMCGVTQAKAYTKFAGFRFKVKESKKAFLVRINEAAKL